MGDERRDDAAPERVRADAYSSARIGAAAAFTLVLVGGSAAVGRKASPGPLYGISRDVWSALAIAVTYSMQAEGIEAA
jgi:hypothetical protein